MCRKLSFLIAAVVISAALSSALATQELKVDLALLKPGSGGEIDEGTAKEGWIIWAWTADEEYHDMQKYENLGGTGIEVRLSLSREGKGALGKSIDGAEPICNTFYHDFDDDEGDVLLGFYNIPAGQYELFGYHREPQGLNAMPSIDVNCVNVGGKWGGDPNCAIDNPGAVVQIHDGETIDVNVGIPGDQIYDDNLPYSLVKFYTNGTDVLVRYRSANKSAVLNAFILVVPAGGLASNPSPGHNVDLVCPDANLVWAAGQLVADTNGHNLYFGTDLRDELLMFEDDLEGGDANWVPSNWTIYDSNVDGSSDGNSHSFSHSFTPGSGSGTLTTVDINASEVGSMTVELWIKKTAGIEAGDIDLYYYDGTDWDSVADLNSIGPNGPWLHYTDDINDSQYFVSDFKIQLRSDISAGELFIDDVSVTNTWPLGAKWAKGPLDANSYDPPGLMELGATYYWRVDEVNDACDASPWKGYLWTFTTEDGKARDPTPYNRQGSLPYPDVDLSWTPSCLATWHTVYVGEDFNDVNTGAEDVNLGYTDDATAYFSGLTYGKRYYWRIDESGDAGVIKGDVWMFQTVGYPLIHYKFDGVIDDNVPLPITDDTGNVTFVHGPGYGSGGEGQLKYDQPNLLYNILGTSAHFMPATPEEGGGAIYLYRKAIDSDILDLDGDEYTIEMWVKKDSDWPQNFSEDKGGDEDYAATLFRKFDRSYVVAIGEDGAARFAHAGLGFSGCRLESPSDRIQLGQWYHIAAVFDFADPCKPEKLYIDGLVVADGNSYAKNPTNDDDPTTIGGTVSPLRVGEGTYMSNRLDGWIDELRVSDVALEPKQFLLRGDANLAWLPRPYNHAIDVPFDVNLIWEPGDTASSHEVYIGTDWNDVNDANNSWPQGTSVFKGKYDVNDFDPGLLDLGVTYYWRVDEVNDTTGKRYKLPRPWYFTVAGYILLDNFEEDKNNNDLHADWWQGILLYTGANITLRFTDPVIGEHSMSYYYNNTFDWGMGWGYYSETQTKNLEPNDWDYYDIRVISLWFYGQAGNEATIYTQMNLGLEDDSNYGVVKYGTAGDEDMTDIQVQDWQCWEILTNRYTNIDFTNVKKFCIGFGIRGNPSIQPTGFGTVYFDGIHLYPPYCWPDKNPLEGDFSENCIIDWADVEIMAEDWLMSGLGTINGVPPDANMLVLQYLFDESAGTTVADNSGNGYTGTFFTDVNQTPNDITPRMDPGKSGNSFHFSSPMGDGGISIPNDVFVDANMTQAITISCWIKNAYPYPEVPNEIPEGGAFMWEFRQWDGNDTEAGDRVLAVEAEHEDDDNDDTYTFRDDDESVSYDFVWSDHTDWQHYAFVRDANTLTIYVDGIRQDQDDSSGNPMAVPGLLYLGIAADRAPNNTEGLHDAFTGNIDDFRIYKYAVSYAEAVGLAEQASVDDPVDSVANIYEPGGEQIINFKDFTKLADAWLKRQLWPE